MVVSCRKLWHCFFALTTASLEQHPVDIAETCKQPAEKLLCVVHSLFLLLRASQLGSPWLVWSDLMKHNTKELYEHCSDTKSMLISFMYPFPPFKPLGSTTGWRTLLQTYDSDALRFTQVRLSQGQCTQLDGLCMTHLLRVHYTS